MFGQTALIVITQMGDAAPRVTNQLSPSFLFATHAEAFSIIERLVPEELRAFAVNLINGRC